MLLYKKDYTGEAFSWKTKDEFHLFRSLSMGSIYKCFRKNSCVISETKICQPVIICQLPYIWFGNMDYECWIEQINMNFKRQPLFKISSLLAYSMSYMANILLGVNCYVFYFGQNVLQTVRHHLLFSHSSIFWKVIGIIPYLVICLLFIWIC